MVIYGLMKKGTDYRVVCVIMYIKGNGKEYIFVLCSYAQKPWAAEQGTDKWSAVCGKTWELCRWKTVRGRDRKEASQDTCSYSVMFKLCKYTTHSTLLIFLESSTKSPEKCNFFKQKKKSQIFLQCLCLLWSFKANCILNFTKTETETVPTSHIPRPRTQTQEKTHKKLSR